MKLTNKLKEQIVDNVVAKFKFIEKRDKILEEERKWAAEYVKSKLSEEFVKISKEHPDWFVKIDSLYVNKESAKRIFKSADSYSSGFIDLGGSICIPRSMANDWCGHCSVNETPFVKKADKLIKTVKELKDGTYRYLNSCTTVKRLIDLYPDIKPFIPSDNGGTSTALMLPQQSFAEMLEGYMQ